VSDEGNAANDAARDGGDSEEGRESGGRTALVTESVTRPARPTGKRSRQRAGDTAGDVDAASSDKVEVSEDEAGRASRKTKAFKKAKAFKAPKAAKKPSKPGDRPANPVVFVYNYLKQVVAEMRKVIWPNRKQMLTYTSVVLAFLAFMVAVVGLADFGLTKLVLLVFG
jgi:preprotein translocase subunit SecE